MGVNWKPRLAVLSAIALAFAGGLFVAILDLPPSAAARSYLIEMRDAAANWRGFLTKQPTYHLEPARHEGKGVIVSNVGRMQPGVTLLTGLFGMRLSFRMIDERGTILHDWPVDFFTVAPEEMRHRSDALIHGTVLYPNGDIVANLDLRGMVRVDRCGNILWRNHARTHHSIHADDAGGVWAPSLEEGVQLPDFTDGTFRMDTLVRIDPATGRHTERIPLIDVLDASDRLGIAQRGVASAAMDVLHTNDVEPLSATMAAAFPMFAAGDLLVSSLNLSQLWVIDGRTHKIKWMFAGPMTGQHDPDFQADGTITLLDNRGRARAGGGYASRILAIDPATGGTRMLFRGSLKTPFYTAYRGKHQVLENGNILITESDGGRAFEVTPAGEEVWAYVNRWDEAQVGWLMQAERYPRSYAVNGAGCLRR